MRAYVISSEKTQRNGERESERARERERERERGNVCFRLTQRMRVGHESTPEVDETGASPRRTTAALPFLLSCDAFTVYRRT